MNFISICHLTNLTDRQIVLMPSNSKKQIANNWIILSQAETFYFLEELLHISKCEYLVSAMSEAFLTFGFGEIQDVDLSLRWS